MIRTIYTDEYLRSKLSNYANERIESVKCDSVQIQIIFKEGYATSFLSSSSCDTEIYFNSIASMKEACKKFYLIEGQENLEKAKAKEQEQEEQEQQKEESGKEEKKENNNMTKDIVKTYVNIESKEGRVKMYYQDLQEKLNAYVEMINTWTEFNWWAEFNHNPYMQQSTQTLLSEVYCFGEWIVEQDKKEALTVLAILKDFFENYLFNTPINLTYFWNAFDRISDQVPTFGDERERATLILNRLKHLLSNKQNQKKLKKQNKKRKRIKRLFPLPLG